MVKQALCYSSPSKTVQLGIINKIDDNNCWWKCRVIETLILADGNVKCNPLENRLVVLLYVKHTVAIWLGNYTLSYIAQIIENRYLNKCLYLNVTEALFKITQRWKQPKCLSNIGQISKMWYIPTMEYYSTIEMNYWYMLQHLICEPWTSWCSSWF